MERFTRDELSGARRALACVTARCGKAQPKLKPGSAQHTLMVHCIQDFRIALALVDKARVPPVSVFYFGAIMSSGFTTASNSAAVT